MSYILIDTLVLFLFLHQNYINFRLKVVENGAMEKTL